MVIDPLKKLTRLEVLGLFNNEIFNENKAIDILSHLQNLRELSIDGNPVSAWCVMFKKGERLSESQIWAHYETA